MTTLLRLFAYPPADLAHLVGFAPPPSDTSPRISCLLHPGPLPTGQTLEVRVQDMALQGQSEGEQQVFSWQCAAGEALRLILWYRGRPHREWLGCWNGEQVLLHAGTLPVQVIFAGKLQPEVDPADLLSLLSASRHNGHATEPGQTASSNLLVVAQTQPEGEHDELESRDAQDGEPGQSASLSHHSDNEFSAVSDEAVTAASEVRERLTMETPETPPICQAPAGTQLAAWHADPTGGDASLEALTAQLVQMPAKTLLVDLRQHPRKASRIQEGGPLSKQTLRQTFGARYWERGWTIRTTQRLHPDSSKARLQCVITNPHDPEGLPLLIERLQRGYSLLLVDRIATYEESARAAVIVALQQQVGNLTVGPLG